MTLEPTTGDPFVVQLNGVEGGFGALKNVQPTVNQPGNVTDATPSTAVLIPAGDITSLQPKNGSATAAGEKEGLRYYIIKKTQVEVVMRFLVTGT